MCKFDLANAYGSIRLPQHWRRVFVIRAGAKRWRFTRLPLGWKYSPAICQHLVSGIVAGALPDARVEWDVYLDDVLITARDLRAARLGAHIAVQALTQAGFIIRPKKRVHPLHPHCFSRKAARLCGSLHHQPIRNVARHHALMVERGRDGAVPHSKMARLPGRLYWIARPLGGTSPFLAGAYATMAARSAVFSRALVRATGAVLLLSFPPHNFLQHARARMHTVFSDVAPCGHRFRVGVVGGPSSCRDYLCPRWVRNM